jgi:hypothetical protein
MKSFVICTSVIRSRTVRPEGHVAWNGEKTTVKGYGGERAGMRHFGRSKHRWKGNIKMDLKDIGWEVTG